MGKLIFSILLSLLSIVIFALAEPDHSFELTKKPNNSMEIPPDTLIEMERTICYGTCPSYTLTIQGNGTVIFDGKQFVSHTGPAEDKISNDKLNDLVQLIREIDFMTIPSNPECESWMTDHPSVFLTIEIDGQRNSVTHYHGCKGFKQEEDLFKLEEAVDSLSGARRWIEGDDSSSTER